VSLFFHSYLAVKLETPTKSSPIPLHTMFDVPAHSTALLAAKASSGKTFDQIASAINKPEVWTTALFFGQTRCDEETAKKIVEVLSIGDTYSYAWGDSPEEKTVSGKSVVMGLAGEGSGSMGVDGMTVRGGTWDGPPKVSTK
jgi:cyanate lyase